MVLLIEVLSNTGGTFMKISKSKPSKESKSRFICVPSGNAGVVLKKFWQYLNPSERQVEQVNIEDNVFPSLNNISVEDTFNPYARRLVVKVINFQ